MGSRRKGGNKEGKGIEKEKRKESITTRGSREILAGSLRGGVYLHSYRGGNGRRNLEKPREEGSAVTSGNQTSKKAFMAIYLNVGRGKEGVRPLPKKYTSLKTGAIFFRELASEEGAGGKVTKARGVNQYFPCIMGKWFKKYFKRIKLSRKGGSRAEGREKGKGEGMRWYRRKEIQVAASAPHKGGWAEWKPGGGQKMSKRSRGKDIKKRENGERTEEENCKYLTEGM